MHRDTFEYSQTHYNEVILWLEEKWQRKLTHHEINVLKYGYNFGRLIEMESYYTGDSIDSSLVKISDTYLNS